MNQNSQGVSFEQAQAYIELRRLLDGFKYKESGKKNRFAETASAEYFDIESGYKTQYLSSHSPESKILESWYEYLGAALVEAQPKDLKDAVKNTEAERRDYLETLEFFMRRKPVGEDLKELLNLPAKYDEVIADINEDIKKLMK